MSSHAQLYRCLVSPGPADGLLGEHTHYMYDGPFGASVEVMQGQSLRPRGPRLLSARQLPGWKECRLVVLATTPVQWAGQELRDLTVELVTGRTHQIRAQLAALGYPILGDDMYQAISGLTVGPGGLAEAELLAAVARTRPSEAIALHAWVMEFNGQRFESQPPWEHVPQ